jgi:hypothetical protein
MNRSMALLVALAVPAVAVAQAAPNPTVVAPRLQRGVEDPRRFVLETYQAFALSEESMAWPEQSYSPRLRALFADYEAYTAAQDGLIGELDFDWWVNAQDWGIAGVGVSETVESPSRRIERVRFRHGDRREEIRLVFVREGGRWFLDEAIEGSGRDGDGWTLSDLLRARPE